MPEYEFFVSGDAPKPANKAMRSHAIKSALALRSRKLKELAGQPEVIPGSQSSRQTQEQKDTLKGRFRLCNRPEDMEKSTRKYSSKRLMPSQLKLSRSPSPVVQNPSPADSQLVSQSLDPFDVLPVENNWRVQRLIQYFLTKFTLNETKNAKQRPYFSMAMSDPLVMRGTLALSCTVWVMSVPIMDQAVAYEGLYQKSQAIKEINREIKHSLLRGVSDAMIVAVANLANVASMEGSFREADMHIRGLKRLVDSRGGAMAFKHTYHIAQAITWNDLQTAAGLGRAPIFPLIHGYMDVNIPSEFLLQADEPSLSHLTSDNDNLDNEDIASIFRCIHQSVIAKKHGVGGPVPTRILHNIAEMYILRRVEREPRTPDEHRLRTLCLAAHVFLDVGMRLIPRNAPLTRKLVGRLRDALDNRIPMNVAAWPRSRLQDLLWVLFAGSVIADGYEHGAWFSVRLQTVVKMTGYRSQDEVRNTLRRYVWSDVVGLEYLDKTWEAVVASNGGVEQPRRALLSVETDEPFVTEPT